MILDVITLFLFDAIQDEIILIILSDANKDNSCIIFCNAFSDALTRVNEKYNGITTLNFSNIYNKYMWCRCRWTNNDRNAKNVYVDADIVFRVFADRIRGNYCDCDEAYFYLTGIIFVIMIINLLVTVDVILFICINQY